MTNLSQVIEVPVGDNLTVQSWQDADGEIVVGLRWACEQIGIAWSVQLQKIRKNPLFKDQLLRVDCQHAGQRREVIGLKLDLFLMFLATINSAFVSERAREPLLIYQRQCAQALRDYWTQGVAINPSSKPMTVYDEMRQQHALILRFIDDLEAQDKRIAQVESNVHSLYTESQMLTVHEFVHHNKLYGKMPRSLWPAYGRHVKSYCLEHGLPAREVAVLGKKWETEGSYPSGVMLDLLLPWLNSIQGQEQIQVISS